MVKKLIGYSFETNRFHWSSFSALTQQEVSGLIESLSTMLDEFNWFLKILSAKVNAFALVFTSIIIAYSRYDMIGDSKPNRN
jgi:hypothetical protein